MLQSFFSQVVYVNRDDNHVSGIGIYQVLANSSEEAFLKIQEELLKRDREEQGEDYDPDMVPTIWSEKFISENINDISDEEGYMVSVPAIESSAITFLLLP